MSISDLEGKCTDWGPHVGDKRKRRPWGVIGRKKNQLLLMGKKKEIMIPVFFERVVRCATLSNETGFQGEQALGHARNNPVPEGRHNRLPTGSREMLPELNRPKNKQEDE